MGVLLDRAPGAAIAHLLDLLAQPYRRLPRHAIELAAGYRFKPVGIIPAVDVGWSF